MPVEAVQAPVSIPAGKTLEGPAVAARFETLLHDLDRGEQFLDRVIRNAMRGRDLSPEELIAVQAGVYRHTQRIEAFSKIVDAVTGSVRRTLEASG